jgi:hypothetical protein
MVMKGYPGLVPIRRGSEVAYDLEPFSRLEAGVQHTEDVLVLVLVVDVLVGAGRWWSIGRSEIQNVVDFLVASCTKHLFRPPHVLALVLKFRKSKRVFLDALAELLV